MIKLVAGIAALCGLLIGAIAGSFVIGVEVAVGFFVIGLLIVITDALLRPVSERTPSPPPVTDDSDLIEEDIEFVFNEDTGELVEVPTAPAEPRRRRRR